MQQQVVDLLAMVPEDRHDAFLSLLPAEAAAALAGEPAEIDAAVLTAIAEAVWACLEQ